MWVRRLCGKIKTGILALNTLEGENKRQSRRSRPFGDVLLNKENITQPLEQALR